MKLSKNNRPKFSIKSIIAGGVVVVIIAVSATSLLGIDKFNFVEKKGFSQLFYSVGKHLNNVVVNTGDFFDDFISFKKNSDKVDELKKENEKLNKEIIKLKSDEGKLDSLEVLKKSLNYVDSSQRNDMVSSRVIGKNSGNWYKSFIIDVGADRGVRKDSIVLNGDGIVGLVYSVNNKYAKVISLVDSRASVSFKISGKEDSKGVITTSSTVGNINFDDNEKLLHGYFFNSNSDAKKGDTIVTSGLGIYPENLPIGEITSVTLDKNKSMKLITVKPYVDFKKINDVSVISPRSVE
nr:rod shape-determining protein MreC [Peptostreptococcus faecalis]